MQLPLKLMKQYRPVQGGIAAKIGISIPIRSPGGVFSPYSAMESEIFAGVLLLGEIRVFAWKLGPGFLEALDKEGVEFADSLGHIGGKIPCLPEVLL